MRWPRRATATASCCSSASTTWAARPWTSARASSSGAAARQSACVDACRAALRCSHAANLPASYPRSGEGALGDTVLEQRANAPLFRLLAPAVVQNLVLDLCGFRECVRVAGDATPLLEGCKLRCSGDHALLCDGACAPTLRGCDLGARRAGVLALGTSRPDLQDCLLQGCEHQGLRAAEAAWPRLARCRILDNGMEGVVAMDAAGVELVDCTLRGNQGPGVDISGRAHAALLRGCVEHNAGGVFLWDDASAALQGVALHGGPHHALLADARSRPEARGCAIVGEVLALSPEAQEGVLGAGRGNTLRPGAAPATLPPEAGCFKFEADRFTRKQ
jgi:hypothetical protein